jgi:hypothetical protein
MSTFPQNSVDRLMTEIHDPIFFQKLASDWNISPRTVDEQSQLIELAITLRDAKENEQVKTASTGNVFLGGALDSLKNALNDRGYPTLPTSDEQNIKAAAYQAVQNPELENAALAYAEFLAQ